MKTFGHVQIYLRPKGEKMPNVLDGYDLGPKSGSPGQRSHWEENKKFPGGLSAWNLRIPAVGDKGTNRSQGDVVPG